MAYMHMFYGDHQTGDNPQTFLRQFEEDLAELLQLSETEKCYRFYNYCCSGSEAEYWYEELERNSPKVLTCWFTLANPFCGKWLRGSLTLLLETPEIKQTQLNTATAVSQETTTTTTTIPTPANTAAPAIYKTTTTPKQLDCMANLCHVIAMSAAPPTQLPTITTTSATTTVSNHTITKVEQQDGEQSVKGKGEEQGRRIKKEVEVREREKE